MKKIILLIFLCISIENIMAQAEVDTTKKVTTLDEVVFSANKFEEKKKFVAQKIDIISSRFIANANAQNTGDLLINTGNVFVQKSQQGGSSPVIRGFEASRVLLVIDGVRMNNAIYRSGHLQNVITVDQNMIERIEILYGPGSTIYGSDALGGVVHLRTKSPKLSGSGKLFIKGSAFARYSSANAEKTVHADLSLAGRKFGWLQAYTFSDFDDMKMGDNYSNKYPDFGRRKQYVAMIEGIDSVVTNSDDRVQKFSGYKQWDITQKLLFRPNEKVSHQLNFQLSGSSNVPRYDRLQDMRNGTLRYAEWYYGPQKRILAAYDLGITKTGFFDGLKVNINYQDIMESRHTRDYRRYDRFDSRFEHIKVWGFVADARKLWRRNELTIGIDGQMNDLKSAAERKNIQTGSVTKLDTRYPDGKNRMNYFALYAQHLYKLAGEKLIVNDGIRFQSVNLHSTLIDNSFFNLPYSQIRQHNFAVTGNLGLVFLPAETSKLSLSLASGFRAPNIDDLAKIFESSTASQQIVVPNPDIKPEYTYNADLSYTQLINDKVRLELTGFHTWFRNALIKAPYQLNGEDSIIYNGVKSQVLASQNRNKAYLYGLSAALEIYFTNELLLTTSLNYTKGRFQTDPSVSYAVYQKQADGTYALVQAKVSTKPLDHIPPVFGKTSLSFNRKNLGTEVFALYNGWKRLKDYNADGEDNAQYATPDGMPSWITFNCKGTYTFNEYAALQLGVENIFDRNYRYFASGFSAPGRNFIIAVRVNL